MFECARALVLAVVRMLLNSDHFSSVSVARGTRNTAAATPQKRSMLLVHHFVAAHCGCAAAHQIDIVQ